MAGTPIELGCYVQRLRKQRGYTQATIAEKIGVAESTVASYETGRNNFTVTTLKRIANALEAELLIEIKFNENIGVPCIHTRDAYIFIVNQEHKRLYCTNKVANWTVCYELTKKKPQYSKSW